MRLPAFVRRHPFPWAIAASLAAGYVLALIGDNVKLEVRRNETQALAYVVQAIGLALPLAVAAAWWRRLGKGMRGLAVAACVAWGAFASAWALTLAEDVRGFAYGVRRLGDTLREPSRAMETPAYEAAERALARGDTFFLATGGGSCVQAPGVRPADLARHGYRVISGTQGDGLTAEHGAFLGETHSYSRRYNSVVLDRLGLEYAEGFCVPSRGTLRFWP